YQLFCHSVASNVRAKRWPILGSSMPAANATLPSRALLVVDVSSPAYSKYVANGILPGMTNRVVIDASWLPNSSVVSPVVPTLSDDGSMNASSRSRNESGRSPPPNCSNRLTPIDQPGTGSIETCTPASNGLPLV